MASRHSTPEASFEARIKRSEGGCWLWTGHVDAKGYGVIGVGGRRLRKVHRYSYERFIGPVPEGKVLDHLCRVRHCANPAHLEPVTNRENVVRGNLARGLALACARGHAFDEANTYINPRGKRECKACRNAAAKRHAARRAA